MGNILYKNSHFKADEFGNGGDKRTAQIDEILAAANIKFDVADFTPYAPTSKSINYYFKGLVYNRNLKFNIKKDYAAGRYISQFENFISQKKPSGFIWESLIEYNLLLAQILHLKEIPFISIPHNLESLTQNTKSFSTGINSPHWFNEELKYLKYSKKVFTISREEQWLLSLYGIDADYLPYYPTSKSAAFYLSLRKKREGILKTDSSKKILLLGTFYNAPTNLGYVNLLQNISKYTDLTINVAGFGSETLTAKFPYPNVNIWGSVDKDTLEELLINNDMAIVHQPPTTGALTRLPELLMAGIPVIANEVASRSNYDLNGVNTYYNYDELLAFIYAPQAIPEIPVKPLAAEKRFINTIKNTFGNLITDPII